MKHTANRRRGVSTRAFVALLALVLVIGCVAGGTVAWLVSAPAPVTNTFTYGDINIGLGESTGAIYKIVPGVNIEKDPKVTVTKGSEACWLFVEVTATGAISEHVEGTTDTTKVTYTIADGWRKLQNGVYYREADALNAAANLEYPVLKDNIITVSQDLTKQEVNNATVKQPTLTFTAYAVQKDNVLSAEAAWAIAKPTTNP